MHSPTASSPPSSADARPATWIGRVLFRKLWIPKSLYEALPYCYVMGGLAALVSALYLPGWTWILPYLVLLGAISLHAGLAVLTLRWRFRRTQSSRPSTD